MDYYGFGPDGAPRPSSRRGTTPPQVPRPRPAPPATANPALANSLVRTVALPSDRGHADPIWELLSYGSRLFLVTSRLHIQGRTPSATPAGLRQNVLNNFRRSFRRTTSLKMTFRLPSNGRRWSRSPLTSRYRGEVAPSRCYTRCIGQDSPNLPGSGK